MDKDEDQDHDPKPRKFQVVIKFTAEIDTLDWFDGTPIEEWGYGGYDPATITAEQVKEELTTCLNGGDLGRDEGGFNTIPSGDLEVVEVK